MDILKRAQTVPTFSVYPDKTFKKFTHHNFFKEPMTISDAINLQDITLPNGEDKNQAINSVITPSLPLELTPSLSLESIPSLPLESTPSLPFESTPSLLLESDTLEKFYVKAALYLGNGKTGDQIRSKIRSLINTYMEESSNKTGKGASDWPFYTEMNNIFGNRENVNPDYLVNSTGQIYRNNLPKDNSNNKDCSLKSNKKRRLDEDELHYIKSIDIITQSKQIEAETKKKLLELEKEKLQFEREKWEHEKNEKIILEKYKLELEYKLQLELKTRELEIKFKNKETTENEL
ncbi:3669_t:CDS:2 [Scutellospora calospora]|uniref:3669_t:CDS:1 n=1 Tax=Scutellospora calospora TaxID=85575 RepID=A0ACA9KSU5_9GLOM|nr:3669_t:CDS:2 [Scutellospora calospora]